MKRKGNLKLSVEFQAHFQFLLGIDATDEGQSFDLGTNWEAYIVDCNNSSLGYPSSCSECRLFPELKLRSLCDVPCEGLCAPFTRCICDCICRATCLENLYVLPFCSHITLMFHEDNVNAEHAGNRGERSHKKKLERGKKCSQSRQTSPSTYWPTVFRHHMFCVRPDFLNCVKGRVAAPLLSVSLGHGNLKQENTVSLKYYTV